MKGIGALVIGIALVGCGGAEQDLDTDLAAADGLTYECSWFNGSGRRLVLPATSSQQQETYAIWNLGNAVINEPYNTSRPDLLMIIPGWEHRVPGFEAFDHDHVMSSAPGQGDYTETWDVFLVVPGPNFDANTYQRVKSIAEVNAAVAAGVLVGPIPLPDAGFPELVIRAPLADPCTPNGP